MSHKLLAKTSLGLTLLGLMASAQITVPITAVSFPKEVIPIPAGKIDFWAKLSGYSGNLSLNSPLFFLINDGSKDLNAGFVSNDGQGGGGLVGRAGYSFDAATGSYTFPWSYEQILGTGHVGDWHHYVLQWNQNGIPGVSGGTQKVAVFLDGRLNSAYWLGGYPGFPNQFLPLNGGTLNLITTSGIPPGAGTIAMEEFRIYDGAGNLVLYNTLGSVEEIEHSVIGLNGSFNGGGNAHFVPGIIGNAVEAAPVASFGSGADVYAPVVSVLNILPGPPKQVLLNSIDGQSGLVSIEILNCSNCTAVTNSFASGTNSPVLTTATKTDPAQGSSVQIRARDAAGNATVFDPVDVTIQADGGPRVHEVKVSAEEHILEIRNGEPGMHTLLIKTGNVEIPIVQLKNGEKRSLDIGDALKKEMNSVKITSFGRPGASTWLVFTQP